MFISVHSYRYSYSIIKFRIFPDTKIACFCFFPAKCGAPLGDVVETKTGRKLHRCSTNVWNPDTRQAEGCDYIQWINGSTEPTDETCPQCGEKLVIYTAATGRKMKKCSAGGWDPKTKKATGCTFIQWL